MQPTYEVFNRLSILLAADVNTLAPAANPPKLKLSKGPFTPNQGNVPLDFTEADFAGYAAIPTLVNAQNYGIDPLTGERLVEMKIPVGGWRFTCTGLANTPQQIFGAYLINDAGTTVYGSVLFDGPVTIDTIAQIIDLDAITFRFRFTGVY